MFTWNEEWGEFTDKLKLPSGQTVRIGFQESYSKNIYYFNIFLEIFHKRKQCDDAFNKQTGKDGLAGLLWAKAKVVEFEEMIVSGNTKYLSAIIFCTWTNNRRRNVYERGLKQLGYKIQYLSNEDGRSFKALTKKVVKSTELLEETG